MTRKDIAAKRLAEQMDTYVLNQLNKRCRRTKKFLAMAQAWIDSIKAKDDHHG